MGSVKTAEVGEQESIAYFFLKETYSDCFDQNIYACILYI